METEIDDVLLRTLEILGHDPSERPPAKYVMHKAADVDKLYKEGLLERLLKKLQKVETCTVSWLVVACCAAVPDARFPRGGADLLVDLLENVSQLIDYNPTALTVISHVASSLSAALAAGTLSLFPVEAMNTMLVILETGCWEVFPETIELLSHARSSSKALLCVYKHAAVLQNMFNDNTSFREKCTIILLLTEATMLADSPVDWMRQTLQQLMQKNISDSVAKGLLASTCNILGIASAAEAPEPAYDDNTSLALAIVFDSIDDDSSFQCLCDYKEVLLDLEPPIVALRQELEDWSSAVRCSGVTTGMLMKLLGSDKHLVKCILETVLDVKDTAYLTEEALKDLSLYLNLGGSHELPSSFDNLVFTLQMSTQMRLELLKNMLHDPSISLSSCVTARRLSTAIANMGLVRPMCNAVKMCAPKKALLPSSTRDSVCRREPSPMPPAVQLTLSVGGCPLLSWITRQSIADPTGNSGTMPSEIQDMFSKRQLEIGKHKTKHKTKPSLDLTSSPGASVALLIDSKTEPLPGLVFIMSLLKPAAPKKQRKHLTSTKSVVGRNQFRNASKKESHKEHVEHHREKDRDHHHNHSHRDHKEHREKEKESDREKEKEKEKEDQRGPPRGEPRKHEPVFAKSPLMRSVKKTHSSPEGKKKAASGSNTTRSKQDKASPYEAGEKDNTIETSNVTNEEKVLKQSPNPCIMETMLNAEAVRFKERVRDMRRIALALDQKYNGRVQEISERNRNDYVCQIYGTRGQAAQAVEEPMPQMLTGTLPPISLKTKRKKSPLLDITRQAPSTTDKPKLPNVVKLKCDVQCRTAYSWMDYNRSTQNIALNDYIALQKKKVA